MDLKEFEKYGFKISKDTSRKEEEELPFLIHGGCGPSSKRQVQKTRKGGLFWHCPTCGTTYFFYDLKAIHCPHKPVVKLAKSGFVTSWCSICRLRIFRRPEEDEELLKFNKKEEVIAK